MEHKGSASNNCTCCCCRLLTALSLCSLEQMCAAGGLTEHRLLLDLAFVTHREQECSALTAESPLLLSMKELLCIQTPVPPQKGRIKDSLVS